MTGQAQNNTISVVRPMVVSNNTTIASGAQVNTVQAPVITHYIKFYMSNTSGANIPYIVVYRENETDNWTIVKVGKTDGKLRMDAVQKRAQGIPANAYGGLISIPIANIGDYRIYLKEPGTTPVVGSTFTIPMHALANGTDSTHEVSCWFAFRVTVATDNASNRTLTTYLPNPQNREGERYGYPVIDQTYTLTAAHNIAGTALLLNNYAFTNQLWADIAQTYGSQHPLIAESAYSAALTTIYNEMLTRGTGRDRTLTYQDGTIQRTIYFVRTSTNNASNTLRFAGTTATVDRMPADEAIRKTHPSVFIYWLGLAGDLDITRTQITSTWRPSEGSTRHRYSLALDIDQITASVVTNQQTNQTTPVTVIFRNGNIVQATEAAKNNPTTTISNNTPLNNKRKIEFSRVFFRRIGQDYIDRTLGWLGGPWTLYSNSRGININQTATLIVTNDRVHDHHVHLSVSREQG